MNRVIYGGLFLVSFGIFTSCDTRTTYSKEIAREQNEQKLDDSKLEKDAEFAVEAADDALLEVRLGRLAQSNASSEAVKAYAKKMVVAHSKATDELRSVAQRKNISLPGTMSEKNQNKYDDLADKKGEEFDKAYCEFILKVHKDDIDAFEKEAKKGNDVDIRSWASGKLPALENHLSMAQNLEDELQATRKERRASSR